MTTTRGKYCLSRIFTSGIGVLDKFQCHVSVSLTSSSRRSLRCYIADSHDGVSVLDKL